MRNLLFLTLCLGMSAWANKPAAKVKAPKLEAPQPVAEVAKSDLLLDIDGSIYPNDQLPESCKDMLKGVKCAVDSFGHYHVESKKDGDSVFSRAVFSDPDGPQVIEQSWEKDGHVQKASVENHALQKLSELEVKDGKVFYKVTDLTDKSVKTSEDDADKNLVVPSTVMSYIRPFNADLAAGKEVELRVAVMDRREAFTFHMKKVRNDKTADGEDVMVLKMEPNSIIVKALVDPMYFYVKQKTGEMFAFEGKSALRRKVGDKYKEMTVRTAYQYKVNTFKLAESAAPIDTCTEDMLKNGANKCSVK